MNRIDFSELTEKRRSWVIANKENGFDKGISNLLTELYPDNAHFIYELLQNAEDAGATEVNFELLKNELRFFHNGKPFDYKDIEAITSIGQGTKANDINKIGKFGVGFKAVFSYTSTPKIYSGDYSFEIVDLVVPIPIENSLNSQDTMMVFPFNRKDKSFKKSSQEIEETFKKLDDNTLLFLTSIKKISYKIKNEEFTIKQEKIDNIRVNITKSRYNKVTKWLRFKKYLPRSKKMYVSIAYKLNSEESKIEPIDGKVSIFFPAEKENSNLKFHIHAPFSSTVARDSIKDIIENERLRDLIVKLVGESLKDIKRRKLLNSDFLSCLPNSSTSLSNFYLPIKKILIDKFNNENYLLIDKGSYKPASKCFLLTNEKLKKVADIDFLKRLIFYQKGYMVNRLYFVNSEIFNSNAKKFIELLNIEVITDKEFIYSLDNLSYSSRYKISEIFFDLPSKWFKELFSFCYDFYNFYNYKFSKKFKRFILLKDNSLNLDGEDCYFSNIYIDNLAVVNENIYLYNKKAKLFLSEVLQVKEIGHKEKIQILLNKKYNSSNNNILDKEHIEDMREFLSYFKKNPNDIDFFKKFNFIQIKGKNNTEKWQQANKIFIDEPYKKTGLNILKKFDDVYFLSRIYYTTLNIDEQKLFIKLLEALDVHLKLKIQMLLKGNDYLVMHKKLVLNHRKQNHLKYSEYLINKYDNMRKELKYPNESEHCSYKEYFFEMSDVLLIQRNKEISLLIWNTIKKIDKKFLISSYQPNMRSEVITRESLLVYSLKINNWIPDKNNNFYRPQDISKDMLPEEFIYDNSNGWLTAIGFGENIRKNKEEYKEKEKIIKEVSSISLDKLEKAKEVGVTDDDIEKLIQEKRIQKLKESLAKNQGIGDSPKFINTKNNQTVIIDDKKYYENLKKENQNRLHKFEIVKTSYKKQDSQSLEMIENFLYKEYEGHCQICGDTFAYKSKNTYKIKSLNVGKLRDVNRKGNTLCLCFKHHAIFERNLREYLFYEKIKEKDKLSLEIIKDIFKQYDWVGKEDIDRKNDAFYMLDEKDEFIRDEVFFLGIKIFGEELFLKFTEAHILEFIEVWNEN